MTLRQARDRVTSKAPRSIQIGYPLYDRIKVLRNTKVLVRRWYLVPSREAALVITGDLHMAQITRDEHKVVKPRKCFSAG
jgi:hypothetical protein